MSYSFIQPKPKEIFSLFSKIWLLFISFTFILFLILNIFILLKIAFFDSDEADIRKQRLEYMAIMEDYDVQIASIELEKSVAETVYASNIVLRDSIKNLFELIPDQITLTRVLMESDSLILYGKTPSREMYNFLLASPLRSIFHESSTVFYLNNDGCFIFLSPNKIIDK